jgi:hypothetical protein
MGRQSITISPQHGMNPSKVVCMICKEGNELAMFGKLPGDEKAPEFLAAKGPCERCMDKLGEYTQQGVVLIVIKDEYNDRISEWNQHDLMRRPGQPRKQKPTPWQFYHSLNVVRREAEFLKMFAEEDLAKGVAFIPYADADQLGLIKESERVRAEKSEEAKSKSLMQGKMEESGVERT